MVRMADEPEDVAAEPSVLTHAHRTIRFLDSVDSPFPGALVTAPQGPLVRQEAERVAGWGGWRYAGAQHVGAPVDVVRRARGHDVLLPWCTERLDTFIDRRVRSSGGLSAGETITVVVSLLRGLGELGAVEAATTTGIWWLTDGGRPVFVLGQGRQAALSAREIVARLQEESADKTLARVLDRIAGRVSTAAGQRRVPRRLLDEGERELLEVAAPRPLERDEDAPAPVALTAGAGALRRRDRGESAARALRREPAREVERPRGARRRSRRALHTVASEKYELLTSALGAVVGRRVHDTSRESTGNRTPPRRGRAFVLAGACAAAVLLAGLLWPSGGEDPAVGSAGGESTVARRPPDEGAPEQRTSPSPAPSETAPVPSAPEDDPVRSLAALIAEIRACAERGDDVCAPAMADGSPQIVDLVAEVGAAGDAALVDRYGDIAVLELPPLIDGAAPEAATIVVLVRVEEKWLVRDAYRVADQPR